METTSNKDSHDKEIKNEEKEEQNDESKVTKKKDEMSTQVDELMKRGEEKSFLKRLMIERHEAEQEEAFIRAQEAPVLKRLQTEQTQKLGVELMRRKEKDIREQKLRQLLRNDAIELRLLEKQLREAYASKSARSQILEREIRRENSKIREMENDLMIQGWYNDDRFDREKMVGDRIRREEFRRALQEQLVSNLRLRQQSIEEKRHEQKFAQDPLAQDNENREDQRRKRERALHLLAEQRAFLEAQKARKSLENQAMLKEHEERARILADKTFRENERKAIKSDRIAARSAIFEKMIEKMTSDERKKREWEDTINELMEEENKNYLENRSREEFLAKCRKVREMREDMERQRITKGETRAAEAKIDREFAEYLERESEKFSREDKRKEEERRAIGLEYGKCLKEAIANDKLRYVQNILQNQNILKRDLRMEEERQKSIEAERSRMLQEHEQHLCGFLKPNI